MGLGLPIILHVSCVVFGTGLACGCRVAEPGQRVVFGHAADGEPLLRAAGGEDVDFRVVHGDVDELPGALFLCVGKQRGAAGGKREWASRNVS